MQIVFCFVFVRPSTRTPPAVRRCVVHGSGLLIFRFPGDVECASGAHADSRVEVAFFFSFCSGHTRRALAEESAQRDVMDKRIPL